MAAETTKDYQSLSIPETGKVRSLSAQLTAARNLGYERGTCEPSLSGFLLASV